MSLNAEFSSGSIESKFSMSINAFNGNTTNLNRCPAPKSKSLILSTPPVQPHDFPLHSINTFRPNMLRPL